jgi:hypothetical protein
LDEWQATRGGGLSTGLLVLLANLFLSLFADRAAA